MTIYILKYETKGVISVLDDYFCMSLDECFYMSLYNYIVGRYSEALILEKQILLLNQGEALM